MALKRVKLLDYTADYAYAPPTTVAVVNTDDIVLVRPVETRRNEPCVRIRFRDGHEIQAVGRPDEFLIDAPRD